MTIHEKSDPAVSTLKSAANGIPPDLHLQILEKLDQLPQSPKRDYLRHEVLSKFVSKETDPALTRRTRAINKWLAAERDNEATTDRLILTPWDYQIIPGVPFGRFLEKCQQLIVDIIGETPTVESYVGSFSGGASTSRGRARGHPATKYVGKAHVTQRALPWFLNLAEELPVWFNAQASLDLKVEIVPGNVMFTVPKKTDIDRVAAKEPDLNMYLQKGIGTYLRRALRRTGINLNDQSKNRSLAQLGSSDGSLSTLDLSSASDSVTRELVFQLFNVYWFTLLDDVRSQGTVIDGEIHVNSMMSSMGNGYTFELESLIFLVLARATAYFTGTRGIISIYGDDIICPTGLSYSLITVLNYVGFQVNTEKSFIDGPFRESCGGHYLNGYDVTPFYIKEPISSVPQLIDVANKLRKWGTDSDLVSYQRSRFNDVPFAHSTNEFACGWQGIIIDPHVEEIWLWLKSLVPSCLWGGGDLSFKYQLVSRDTSDKVIRLQTKSVGTGNGGYHLWLNSTWERTNFIGEGLETSRRVIDSKQLRLRDVREKTVPRLPALFLHELG